MKKTVCELCESTAFIKENDMFICQNCGTKYTAEQVKNMMKDFPDEPAAGAPVVHAAEPQLNTANLMETAVTEMKNSQHKEAAKHFDMVVINDPSNIDAPFFRAYCNCFDIKLGEMSNAAIGFQNAFCRYVDSVKALNDPAAEKEKLDYAVSLLTGLAAMYQANAGRTMLTAPTVGLSISAAAKNMNTVCTNKLRGANVNVSAEVLTRNTNMDNSNNKMKWVLAVVIALGIVGFIVFMLWGIVF